MPENPTAGQAVTATIRRMFAIGPRTRWNRKAQWRGDVHPVRVEREAMLRTMFDREAQTDDQRAGLRPAHAALCGWVKHVEGYRIDPGLRLDLAVDSSPYEWTAFLGRMVDSGNVTAFEFEQWFAELGRQRNAQRAA